MQDIKQSLLKVIKPEIVTRIYKTYSENYTRPHGDKDDMPPTVLPYIKNQ